MPGYHKKKNKQKKAHHNGEPHDHPHKKKEDLKKRLAKINDDNTRGDVDKDKDEHYKSIESNEYYNKHDADMGGYNKDILDKVQLKNQKKVKKGKKVPQDKIRETPTKENYYQTHMDSKGAFEQRALKEKVKKADLSGIVKEQKKKKGKERLVHKASKGVDTYSSQDPKNSKVKKKHVKGKVSKQLTALRKKVNKIKNNPPQGPSGGTADTPEAIRKDAEAVAKTPSYIAKDHDHTITFKGYKGAQYKRASLISNTGKYAKYWLLNAKQTNGNGWGVSQQSIAKNIHKFVGKPLVVTAKSWIPDSEYGDAYEHPYLPTNDISKVFDHQEKFRVGSIVDIIEKDGDYFANIELNQKFAHMVMPPFCSPAIFQNNPSEPEGQIEDWEALHLAALHEDPAYGSRIALLRGTCVGTKDQCTVQFKSAKQEAKMVCIKGLKGRIARVKKKPIGTLPRGKGKDKTSELSERAMIRRMKEDYAKGKDVPRDDPEGYYEKKMMEPNRPDTEDPPAAMYMTEEYIKKHKLAKERLAGLKKNKKTSDQAIDDVIKDIKDPDLREDAETRHHHTRPKRLYNYNKKAKLKQRLAAVQQLTLEGEPAPERVKGRQRKVAKTKEEVIKAMKEGKPMRTNTPLRYGERLPPTYRTDGKSFFLYNNKILSKQGNGYQTHVKDFINNDNYEQITLNTLRDFGIQVNSEGKIIPTKKFFTKDGLAMKIKTKGDLTKKDMVIPANEISDNRVLVNKYKSSTGIKPDTYPYTPENLRNFSAESRRRATSMQVDSEGKTVPVGTLKGDPTGINKRSLSETATQPEDAKTVNKILGLPEEQGLEKTFGKKKYNKKKTKTTYNKGEYQGIEGSKTHHILFKDTFKGKKHPLDRFKHTRNVKATPKGSFARPFANNPRNPIQVSKPEHKEIHNLNPHSGFRYILESKLKQRLSKILDNKE